MTRSTEQYRAFWHPFSKHRLSDSCWSLSTGPDRRIYAAACCESMPGGVVQLVRYDDRHDTLEYLFALDKMVGDPGDSGRATQCKIHYSFVPSVADGILYMATHLSGPPVDQPVYSPWGSWHDPRRCFRGSALLALDTRTDRVLWWDTILPKEGCRCLLLDAERDLLYALSYPRDHLISYDLKRRRARTLGRIGSINAQALFLDRRHRVWTSSDQGRLVRYDPESDRLEVSPYVLPHDEQYQTGWHSVFYDAAAAPDGECVYAGTWIARPRLMRIWPDDGPWGRVEDLGPATQTDDPSLPISTFVDHCGGLVFGPDCMLYYVASAWESRTTAVGTISKMQPRGIVWRMDCATLKREPVATLDRGTPTAQYVSRGAVNRNGDLFFGHVGTVKPVGIFRLQLPASRKGALPPLRMWG